jgi:hypothetical protein
MNGLDGQKQRNALTAAEKALRALGAGDATAARVGAAKAAELDQIGAYGDFADEVISLAAGLDAGDQIRPDDWDRLAETLGMTPLRWLLDELRG